MLGQENFAYASTTSPEGEPAWQTFLQNIVEELLKGDHEAQRTLVTLGSLSEGAGYFKTTGLTLDIGYANPTTLHVGSETFAAIEGASDVTKHLIAGAVGDLILEMAAAAGVILPEIVVGVAVGVAVDYAFSRFVQPAYTETLLALAGQETLQIFRADGTLLGTSVYVGGVSVADRFDAIKRMIAHEAASGENLAKGLVSVGPPDLLTDDYRIDLYSNLTRIASAIGTSFDDFLSTIYPAALATPGADVSNHRFYGNGYSISPTTPSVLESLAIPLQIAGKTRIFSVNSAYDGQERLWGADQKEALGVRLVIGADDGGKIAGTDVEQNILVGGKGSDTITNTGTGVGLLMGGDGDDTMTAGSGGDYLDGGAGKNVLIGGKGDDTFFVEGGQDQIDGGDGKNTIDFSGTANPIQVMLGDKLAVMGTNLQTTFANIQSVTGSSADDEFTFKLTPATPLAIYEGAHFDGGAGNDLLTDMSNLLITGFTEVNPGTSYGAIFTTRTLFKITDSDGDLTVAITGFKTHVPDRQTTKDGVQAWLFDPLQADAPPQIGNDQLEVDFDQAAHQIRVLALSNPNIATLFPRTLIDGVDSGVSVVAEAAGIHITYKPTTDEKTLPGLDKDAGASGGATPPDPSPTPTSPAPSPVEVPLEPSPDPMAPITPTTIDPAPTDPGTPSDADTTYRFFDTINGTQFLTSSSDERDTLIGTRPDLTYEGTGIRTAHADPTDPNVAPVYRFFSRTDGTHFFTDDAGERDQTIVTRADLTYEGPGFSEHLTAQEGDVPIFRFFNATNGSHFLTSSNTERAEITATRPDMTFEGVAFYAPVA